MDYLFNVNINKSLRILFYVLVSIAICTSTLLVANVFAQDEETVVEAVVESEVVTNVEASEQIETVSTSANLTTDKTASETASETAIETVIEKSNEINIVSMDESIDMDLFEHGLSIYKASYCGLCHESKFADTKGIFGPPHYSVAIISEARIQDVNYKESNGTATTVEAYLRESILEPEVYVVPGYALARHRMPAYINLTDEDIDALIYLLLNAK